MAYLAGSLYASAQRKPSYFDVPMVGTYMITHQCGRQFYKEDFNEKPTMACIRCNEIVVDNKLNRTYTTIPKPVHILLDKSPKKRLTKQITDCIFGTDKQTDFTSVVNWDQGYNRMKTE